MTDRAADYDYELPPDRIAQHPAPERDASRLLHLPRVSGPVADHRFSDLAHLLRPGDVLVLNETAVVPARLLGRRPSGGKVQLLVLRALPDGRAEVLLRSGRRPARGEVLDLEGVAGAATRATIEEDLGGGRWVVALPGPLDAILAASGRAPLPPYIRRPVEPEAADPDRPIDLERYQTVYARHPGAIAAPTAGLHFTPDLLDRLAAAGVEVVRLTLHVGEGTFKPIATERLDDHPLAPEGYEIPPATWSAVERARADGRRVIAVGTTTCRALETGPGRTSTDLFIRPGHPFRALDGLITNFHLPRSTLICLVAALAGRERVLAAYGAAIERGYRFYSYGDAMLVL